MEDNKSSIRDTSGIEEEKEEDKDETIDQVNENFGLVSELHDTTSRLETQTHNDTKSVKF